MFTKGQLIFIALCSASVLYVTAQSSGDIGANCLGCLCEASTNCTATQGCGSPYPGGYFCGPFFVSRGYWIDAGKPVLGGDDPDRNGAFENCANDVFCAADTVINYMKKFGQDCNGDGRVDCTDYAFIHVLGGYGCSDPSFVSTPWYQRFLVCTNVLNAATINQ